MGIGALELQRNQLGSEFIHAFFGPGCRVGSHILVIVEYGFRPIVRFRIPNFHCNYRLVGHFTFEIVKGITGLPSDGNGFVAFAQGNFLY